MGSFNAMKLNSMTYKSWLRHHHPQRIVEHLVLHFLEKKYTWVIIKVILDHPSVETLLQISMGTETKLFDHIIIQIPRSHIRQSSVVMYVTLLQSFCRGVSLVRESR